MTYTPIKPDIIEKNIFLLICSESINPANKAVKIGYRYCITVASESDNLCNDSYTKNRAMLPTKPLIIRTSRFFPRGFIPFFNKIR